MLTLILALVLGLGLLVAEAHLPTAGALGAAGLAAAVAAVVLAITASGGSLLLAAGIAVPLALAGGGLGAVAVGKARTAGRQRARGGAGRLVGKVGVVRRALDPAGQVAVAGELWRARRSWAEEDEPVPEQGEAVVVEAVDGLTLHVRRAERWEVER